MSLRLLLLSNSRDAEGNYLVQYADELRDFLDASVRRVLFVPFASVRITFDAYAARVRDAFEPMGYGVSAVHEARSRADAVRDAEAILVGGGNTFHLLATLHRTGLLDAIRARVREGVPYVGWSAGSVVACPTISTTNDMPIIAPPSLDALGFVPFQINAHYTDFHPPGHQGETRAERLEEFLTVNPGVPVIGLPEGDLLRVEDRRMTLVGTKTAKLFRTADRPPEDLEPGSRLDELLADRG
jgi:dipeptidase E